jgi:hypothetical protein
MDFKTLTKCVFDWLYNSYQIHLWLTLKFLPNASFDSSILSVSDESVMKITACDSA